MDWLSLLSPGLALLLFARTLFAVFSLAFSNRGEQL